MSLIYVWFRTRSHMQSSSREKAIKDLLARSAGKLDNWEVRGLVGSLKLPMAWIDDAKV